MDGRSDLTAAPGPKSAEFGAGTHRLGAATASDKHWSPPTSRKWWPGNEGARKFERLYQLITQNLSFELFQAVKEAKERLSVEPAVRIDIPEIDIDVSLERAEFETMIAGPLETFDRAVQKVLGDAGLGPPDVDVVLRTGGSALIPAFAEILEHRFPAKVVQYDPFTGVASGLAVADYYGIGNQP